MTADWTQVRAGANGHTMDGMINLCGAVDNVYFPIVRRIVAIGSDDKTPTLFRLTALRSAAAR